MLSSRLQPAPCLSRRRCRPSSVDLHGRQLGPYRCTALKAAAAQDHSSPSSRASNPSSSSSYGSRTVPIGRLPGHRVRRPWHRLAAIERQVDFELQRRATSRIPEVNELNAKYGFKSLVEFYEAENGLPACYLLHPRGHILEVYLQGATITRWIDEVGKNLLFVRPDAVFEPGRAINSGIPLFFPQWREGLLPEMGFADKLKWEVVATDLDFEFLNQEGFPDFAGGEASLLVDDDFDSPFTMVMEPDNYLAAMEDAQQAALQGRIAQGGTAPKPAAAGKKGRGKRKKEPVDTVSPAAALGELPKPFRTRRGRPKNPPPGPAGGPVVGAAAASPPEEAGPDAGKVGEGEAGQQPAQEAAAAAAGMSAAEEADLRAFEEWMNNVDWGLIGDLAPCVTLRLTDTAETRAMWPHKFELLYKITLMENDDFPDPTAGLPDGVFEYTGSTANVPPFMPQAPEDGDTLPGPPKVNDISTGDADEVPMQIKLEWHLTNKGEAGEAPMEFQLGARTLFATKDQASYRNMVQVLGLGGKMMLDYEPDTRAPHLNLFEDDYLDFDGARHDAVYINTQDATVKFCPGGRTHFELLQREGLNDTIAYHPGGLPPPGLEQASRFMAGVGVGRIAVPKRLAPGDSWRGEYVIRHHRRYWEPPMWGRRQPQPMPGLVLEDDEADSEDAVSSDLLKDMERQQVGGLVADGPR